MEEKPLFEMLNESLTEALKDRKKGHPLKQDTLRSTENTGKYINIDAELLFEELSRQNWSLDSRILWHRWEPTLQNINQLFNDYFCKDLMEYYYDPDPEYTDEERIKRCNWQDAHYKGAWGVTQQQVDNYAKKTLLHVSKAKMPHKDRFWTLIIPKDCIPSDLNSWDGKVKEECRMIFYYGRDYLYMDYLWTMEKREGINQ